LLTKASYIKDPSPIHLTVDTDTDDLSNPEHFSLISFEKSMRGNGNPNSSSSVSNYNLVETNNSNNNNRNRRDENNRHSRHNNRRSHRRVRSWDSNTNVDLNTGIGSSKSCLAVPKVLRRERVMVADVASVGNASDTLVSIVETNNGNGRGRITGRELHETAKAAMNEGDYENALNMFEAILRAQLDRFGSEEHSSVGAALHNVGVVRLRIGEPLKAEEAFLRALAIRRNVLEAGHLDLAVSSSLM
jgi:tetratricopeptide (TPR) repeat protein